MNKPGNRAPMDIQPVPETAAMPREGSSRSAAPNRRSTGRNSQPSTNPVPSSIKLQTAMIDGASIVDYSASYLRLNFHKDPSLVRSPPPISPLSDYGASDKDCFSGIEQMNGSTYLNKSNAPATAPDRHPIDIGDAIVPSPPLSDVRSIKSPPSGSDTQATPLATPSLTPASFKSHPSSALSDAPEDLVDGFGAMDSVTGVVLDSPDDISEISDYIRDAPDDISEISELVGTVPDHVHSEPSKNILDYDYDGPEGHKVLLLKPTSEQWADFPAILAFARNLGADNDGCFKVVLPPELLEPLPEKKTQKVPANAYKPRQIKRNSFWQVDTVPSEGTFASATSGPECTVSAMAAVDLLKKMFRKNNAKLIRNVRYRVDVPAWTAAQRHEAGVPERSPIYPLKGDKLDETLAVIPGIHTPYVYESGPYFGASFQIHAEDFRLVSLNHLYKGRKIWLVVPSTAVDVAEQALGRNGRCSQFMRHRAQFFFPQKLDKLGIPYRIVDQRPGETVVILPDAYHEGFSTGYTIAEAKNYGDAEWSTDRYQPCEASCQLVTAIPAELMRPLKPGEVRLDLCADFDKAVEPAMEPIREPVMGPIQDAINESTKRHLDDMGVQGRVAKRREVTRIEA